MGPAWTLVLPLVLPWACATAPRPAVATADSERMVLDLRAKNSGYVRRIEELENRIFVLEDQLDSRKLAAEQKAPATLPVRALRSDASSGISPAVAVPTSSSVPTHVATSDDAGSVDTSIVSEQGVDYTGDAAQPGTAAISLRSGGSPRPVLRLSAPEPSAEGQSAVLLESGSDSLKIYRQALEALRAGQSVAALAGFHRFLDGNPQHDYADNAQYWIGECHYDLRQFKTAEREFRKVVERYPRGNKVPDAMLKLGFTLQMLGDDAGGRAVLESLARAFPKHEAARLASARLAHPEPPGDTPGQPRAQGAMSPSSLSVPAGGAGGVPH